MWEAKSDRNWGSGGRSFLRSFLVFCKEVWKAAWNAPIGQSVKNINAVSLPEKRVDLDGVDETGCYVLVTSRLWHDSSEAEMNFIDESTILWSIVFSFLSIVWIYGKIFVKLLYTFESSGVGGGNS